MGQDKALIQYHGVTLLRHMISVMAKALDQAPEKIWVSGKREGSSAVPDRSTGMGPLGGVSSVFQRILEEPVEDRPEYLLFVPVDMPYVSPETLKTLLASFESSTSAVAYDRSEMPFACRVNSLIARVALDRSTSIDPAKRSVRSFHAEVGTIKLSSTPAQLTDFVNLNTPHDLEMTLGL